MRCGRGRIDQRSGHGMAGEEVSGARMVKPGPQHALQGRGSACQGVPQPLGEPRVVRGEVGVVTVEDAQLLDQLVVAGVKPVDLVAPGAAGVGDHEGVAVVGLGLAGVEVGDAGHEQAGHVGHRHTEARSDGEHEAGERAGLVDDQVRARSSTLRISDQDACPHRRVTHQGVPVVTPPRAVERQGALSHAGTAGLPAREATQAAERKKAMARRLAVLLHALGRSGEVCEPLRHATREEGEAA